jgi:hypothetical protein
MRARSFCGGVAGADGDLGAHERQLRLVAATRAMPSERRAQIPLDVDGERSQRRDVQHAAARVFLGGGEKLSLSSAHRNAASVLPEPVGAQISVERPAAISAQPRDCARVGAAKLSPNHSRTAGWNTERLFFGATSNQYGC